MNNRESRLEKQWRIFHEANPHVYVLVERFALEVIATGRKHFGISMIWERMRWYLAIEMKSKETYKLNNNYRAYYAREFVRRHPEYVDFFEIRATKAEAVRSLMAAGAFGRPPAETQ